MRNLKFKEKPIEDEENNPIEELLNIYNESEEPEAPEKNKQEKEQEHFPLRMLIEKNRRKQRNKILLYILSFIVILTSAAAAGFFYFSQYSGWQEDNVMLEISGPEKSKLGETFDYLIKYHNLGETEIQNARLYVQYPHGFIFESADPAEENYHWVLGNLAFNDSGEIKITGKIIDELSREQKISATLNFVPANFNSEFSRKAAFNTAIESPSIEILSNIPSTTILGQKQNITIKIKNTGTIDFTAPKIVLNAPPQLNIQSTKPTTGEDREWILPNIEAMSEGEEIQIEAVFPADMKFENEEAREFEFPIQFQLPGAEGQYYIAKEQIFSTKIVDQAVTAHLIVNGSTENKHIEFGSNLTFSVITKNNSEETYNNIKIKAVLAGAPVDILDWQKIEDENYGKIQKTDLGKEIVWSKSQITELAKFSKGNEQMITFKLPIKSFDDLKDTTDLTDLAQTAIDAFAIIELAETPEAGIPPIQSSPIKLILDTNLDLGSKALFYYSDGTQIGSGPFPPRVDQTTKLQIFWDISNDLHELSDISVTTELPKYVQWTGSEKISAGAISFDENTRKLTWTINRLPASAKEAHANFGIEFTPTKNDLGNVVKLTGNVTLSAKDTVTDNVIVKTKNIITSVLDQDPMAESQGFVIP
ncbi:hypothetical protein KKC32_03485 [Patescibacteria group bacterium]|nr:hypothetical protein [Patescibacteria group bacterium]